MDPALATLVLGSVNTAANAASQEAGKRVWQGLVALVRRARRHPTAVVEGERPEDLAATLIEKADEDPRFAADLRFWIEQVAGLDVNGDMTNSIGGDARVTGNIVQARDVSGSITFG
ncbi:hypothetical protein [Actinospica robiniae]|uniref:hypothetical protein n=1 Tax=Actinospica robiniae TaxID=304901 RepID=UPI0012F728D9|nr:hypothetical protein [Actinospica robiniae]